jgi:Tfp pilus assembly protein PilV
MNRIYKNEKGFSAVEILMAIVIVVLIGVVGWLVYNHHKTTTASNTAKTSTTPTKANTSTSTSQKPPQKYITISAWGVRVPYSGNDTLSVSGQTCTENGDSNGDTVNLGCQVTVNSQNLTNSVGSCTAKVSGKVGYFYRMGSNDNYGATNGSGYTPVAQWAARNQGQYTRIGSYYYAFAEIGRATGLSGAAVADSSVMNGTYTGCSAWQTEYNTVEQSVQKLASKFETIRN